MVGSTKASRPPEVEICILAGGLSRRMGRPKQDLPLDGSTLLEQICARARQTGWPVTVIRRDAVPRCGPLGGILTGLLQSKAPLQFFLACDMPMVSPELLGQLRRRLGRRQAVFVKSKGRAGFPAVLRRSARSQVEGQIKVHDLSLQSLARRLRARTYSPRGPLAEELLNVNTPGDWRAFRQAWRRRSTAEKRGAGDS